MRVYDPRLGRLLSVDPITKEYPELTPYQFASNRPIDAIDLDGEEMSLAYFNLIRKAQGKPTLSKTSLEVPAGQIKEKTKFIQPFDNAALNKRIVAQKYGRNELEKNRPEIYFKNRSDDATAALFEVATWTDFNDAYVLSGTILDNDNAKNVDGTHATTSDKVFAGVGIFLPIVSGALAKKGGSVLIEGTIKVFKNGDEIVERAFKFGKYGFKGTRAFNEIVRAVQAGGNFVANTKEEALTFLKEAFPDIVDETGKAASRYGYRVDEFVESSKTGLKQGHQGTHINYYDKDSGIRGAITIENPSK